MSEESRFTPGPWRVAANAHNVLNIVECTDHRVAVTHRNSDRPDAATSEANARLIAASPELYEACARLVEQFGASVSKEMRDSVCDKFAADHPDSAYALARAALSRVHGEAQLPTGDPKP